MRPPSVPRIGRVRHAGLLRAALVLALIVQLGGLVEATPREPPTPAVPVAAALPSAPQHAGRFRWPVTGAPRPVRRFDPPPRPWLPGHRGVDLAAPAGTVIRSAGPGTVLFAGLVAGRPVITVGHADGLRTTHEPVRPAVRPGQQVTAGTPLGELLPGHPGCPAAACLHWGLRRGTDYLDPLALLGLGPVRLLPVNQAGPPLPVHEAGPPLPVHGAGLGEVSAGRAAPAAARPAARTRRRCCRPDR
ncbi:murein hydrolase activator EnvC family protein [Micromonospora zamorensis]|uniref:murein hydrolase activator EnvC family protein n=1 Tax=Micromonospora zamorensis TaxID=709883 RepID=UPI00081FED2F|nr:M23 family metallopeptidase [Micromonospora zamorensis]SCG38106.1 Peptidase family M23 [Micromonospora zamorensis]